MTSGCTPVLKAGMIVLRAGGRIDLPESEEKVSYSAVRIIE